MFALWYMPSSKHFKLFFFFSVQNTDECINNTKIYGYIKNVFAAETLPMLLYSSLFLFLLYLYKWSRVIHNRVLKSHRSKMSKMYMKLWKQCALLVITTMTLWQLMHLGTWCHVPKCMSFHKAIVVITTREYCLHAYIYHHAYLALARFEHSVCHGLIMTTIYDHFWL